ncbi:MAG: OmpA family protein, partial [Gemmatimonadota bacterium]|nr:OmpA family protein [Gemmatimonadota bacterium]
SRPRPVQPQATPNDAPPVAIDPARDDPAGRANVPGDRAPETAGGARDPGWAVLQARIYFDFDRSNLTADSRTVLAAKLNVLLANPDIQIQIVGHADERGSDEYNLALGLERAGAARRFLTQRGVSSDRISAVSMGEEHPLCNESNESCWRQNRRDDFVITNSGQPRRP